MENVDFRIDGEFHRKPFPKNPKHQYTKIENILTFVQYGVSIDMNEENVGYPIYRMNEISNMLCNTQVLKCANLTPNEANQYILEENDVLFNRTNSQVFVGRTGIFKKFSENPYIFASYLIRLRTDESKVLPEYLTSFLGCKYGVWDIKRRARISINQSNVNAEEVKATVIPLLNIGFQKQLRELFNKAHLLREESKALYAEAENLLLGELGLRDWDEKCRSPHVSKGAANADEENTLTNVRVSASVNYSVKSFRESFLETGRLDAEYYQPKYDELKAIIKKNAVSVCRVKSIATFNQRGDQPRYVADGELKIINSRHILDQHLDYDNFERTTADEWNTFPLARVFKDDILIYTTGANVGRANVYLSDEPALASNHVNILRIENANPRYVGFVLNSMVGRMQTRQIITGSAQAELYSNAIEQFLIPFVSDATQEKIISNVEESFLTKQKSKQLLELAKRAVELAIEEDENAALVMIQCELLMLVG